MKTNISGIYSITNIATNKRYVGSAISIKKRWIAHKASLRHNRHDNDRLQNAWNSYGESAFVFDVLECVSDISALIVREQYWMDFFKSHHRDIGYNILPVAGSALGAKLSIEARKKMSLSRTGKKMSPESIEKTRLAHLGSKRTEETKRRISESKKGHKQSAESIAKRVAKNTGRKHTVETIAKMSAAKKGKVFTAEHRARLSEAAKKRYAKDAV